MKDKKIDERTFDFSVMIIDLYKFLIYEKKEYVMSKQLLRCGTSIGANTSEAQAAQSKKDFISKIQKNLYITQEVLYLKEKHG